MPKKKKKLTHKKEEAEMKKTEVKQEVVTEEVSQPCRAIEDGFTYKALAMGRNSKGKWAALIVTIENGHVVEKRVVESGGGKSSAIAKSKIELVRTLSREEPTIL